MRRRTSPRGLDLIRSFEGFRAAPYVCPAGWWTIGYGAVRDASNDLVGPGTPAVDEGAATSLLARDVAASESAVARLTSTSLTDDQFDALVSFTFNLGGGALQRSTLRQVINRGEHERVPHELAKWVRGGGRVLPGLVRRRAAESALYQES